MFWGYALYHILCALHVIVAPGLFCHKNSVSLCITPPLAYYLIYTLSECQHLELFEGHVSFKFNDLLLMQHFFWTKKLNLAGPFRNTTYILQDFSIRDLHILSDSTNNMEVWDSFFSSGNQPVLRILDILYTHIRSRSLKCVLRQFNSSQTRRSWMEVHSEWWTDSLFETVTSLLAWEQAKSVSSLAWELGCPRIPAEGLFD